MGFQGWRQQPSAIREIHRIREADEIQELLLFCDQDKKIEKRKKYFEGLRKERKWQVQQRCKERTPSGEV